MSDLGSPPADSSGLLFYLKRCRSLCRQLAECLDVTAIANTITNGLVDEFGCAFARIWIVEPDRQALRLVASAGLHTRLDGSFARVPMGAFKVGKIAQHSISFLSNRLSEEPWVKDRDWAIANHLQGFAGLPLVRGNQTLGVLAVFSHGPMAPEFLEALQVLSDTLTVALASATRHQQTRAVLSGGVPPVPTLSERLGAILGGQRLSLIGTERSVSAATSCLLVRATEQLAVLDCSYCRLMYAPTQVQLDAMVAMSTAQAGREPAAMSQWADLRFACAALGGSLAITQGVQQTMLQVRVTLPQGFGVNPLEVRVGCRTPVLQAALTRLAHTVGLTVISSEDPSIPLLTDVPPGEDWSSDRWHDLTSPPQLYLVVQTSTATQIMPLPADTPPDELRTAIAAALAGELSTWEIPAATNPLSDREREILGLLAQGMRDRDVAENLFISERTVKFHLNNALTKLNARTRLEAVYKAAVQRFIQSDSNATPDPLVS